MRRVDVSGRDRPASALASEPVDVFLELALVFRTDDLVALVTLHHVVKWKDEGDVAGPALAGVIPSEVETATIVRQATFEVPALTRTIFLLHRGDVHSDGGTRTFELEP